MGGGVIRTAAKIPGISAVRSAFRPSSAAPPAEQSLRNASLNVSPAIVSSQNPNDLTASAVEKSSGVVDEWDFASDFEDWEGSWNHSGQPLPRVVFSGAPSFDEAKEATSELKDALEKVYLSSNNSGTDDSTSGGQTLGLSLISNSYSESKPTLASEAVAAAYTVPSHAVQAFRLLSQSPAAQCVVASIASDRNVWNAVLENEALKDYIQSQKASSEFPSEASAEVASMEDDKSPAGFKEVSDNNNFLENIEHSIISVLQNIKLSVVEMVSNISGYLHNIFSFPGADKTAADDANSGSLSVEKTLGASFMGLAILVVMVVLLKRV